ncbi:MAG: SHOCT domain-containing protein [Verrucomicrobia bacterium]|nr:SHOCT domain-containing protein [Verrucomicrobiota bacterium]
MARRNVSEERKTVYYIGMVLMILGFLTFGSVFVTGACNFGDFDSFETDARSSMIRGIVGMAMMIVGGIVQGIGRLGMAGSGVVLNPERAREGMEPWSRMTGGMIKDALDEASVDLGAARNTRPKSQSDFDEKLRKLHRLYEEGILSKEEYEREKREVLDSN